MANKTQKKAKISVSVDVETLMKIEQSISERRFRNRSHAFEYSINTILNDLKNRGKRIK